MKKKKKDYTNNKKKNLKKTEKDPAVILPCALGPRGRWPYAVS